MCQTELCRVSVFTSSTTGSQVCLNQKQPPEVFSKKGVLKNFAKFTGKHLCQSLFFNKVAGLIKFLLKKMQSFSEHVFSEHPWETASVKCVTLFYIANEAYLEIQGFNLSCFSKDISVFVDFLRAF